MDISFFQKILRELSFKDKVWRKVTLGWCWVGIGVGIGLGLGLDVFLIFYIDFWVEVGEIREFRYAEVRVADGISDEIDCENVFFISTENNTYNFYCYHNVQI